MKRWISLTAVAAAIALPASAAAENPGQDRAGACGAYHGMFALPAHGFLRDFVPLFATSGVYKGGFVGDNAKDPRCHEERGRSGD